MAEASGGGGSGIPAEVTHFLADHIESVLELELLLALRADAARTWTATDLATQLRIDAAFAAAQLEKFYDRHLLSAEKGTERPDPAYRYAPASSELDAAVAAVAATYASHRVTIIGLIFSKPTSNLKTFADAFRIRKDKGDKD